MSDADNNRRKYYMARTVRTKVYRFNELGEDAKQRAIEDYRNDGIDVSYLYDEAHESVKAFNSVFGTDEGNRSWLDVRFDSIDNNLLELKGLRLRTYIINNFYDSIYEGKYVKSWQTDKPVKHKKVKSELMCKANGWTNPDILGKYWNEYRKLEKESSCPFTGVCYDAILLQPIIEFIEWKLRPDYNSCMDFETLITDCFESLRKSLEDEEEYRNSDEAISEDLEANEYEYTADGRQF